MNADWYCDDCMEWTNERGDDAHVGHEIHAYSRADDKQ